MCYSYFFAVMIGRNYSSDPEITILEKKRRSSKKRLLRNSDVKFTRRRIVQLADSSIDDDMTCDVNHPDEVSLKNNTRILPSNSNFDSNLDTSSSRQTSNRSGVRKSLNNRNTHSSFEGRLKNGTIPTEEETWLCKSNRTFQKVNTPGAASECRPSLSDNKTSNIASQRIFSESKLTTGCGVSPKHVKMPAPNSMSSNAFTIAPMNSARILHAAATHSKCDLGTDVQSKRNMKITVPDVPTFSLDFGLDFLDDFSDDIEQPKIVQTNEVCLPPVEAVIVTTPSLVGASTNMIGRGVFGPNSFQVRMMEAMMSKGVRIYPRPSNSNISCVRFPNAACSESKASHNASSLLTNTSIMGTPTVCHTVTSSQKTVSSEEKQREERIRLSLQKKEEFKRKFTEGVSSSQQTNSTTAAIDFNQSQPCKRAEETASLNEMKGDIVAAPADNCIVQSTAGLSPCNTIKILVDSRELNSAQVITSINFIG